MVLEHHAAPALHGRPRQVAPAGRRSVIQAGAGAAFALAGGLSRAEGQGQGVALYSAVDAELTHFEVDVATGGLTRRSTIELPAKLQYA